MPSILSVSGAIARRRDEVGLVCAAPFSVFRGRQSRRRDFHRIDVLTVLRLGNWDAQPAGALPTHGGRPVDLSAAVTTPRRRPGPLRVGLAWAGNPAHRRDAERSLSLDQLAPVLDVPDTDFIAIQHGAARHEIVRLGLAIALRLGRYHRPTGRRRKHRRS